jgi:hypothetical protein
VADREAVAKFSATVNRTSDSPEPDGVATDTQLAPLLAVHEHPDVVRTRTDPGPPSAATDTELDASWKAHGTGVGVGVGCGGGVGAGVGVGGGVGAGGGGVGGGGPGAGGVATLGCCDMVRL